MEQSAESEAKTKIIPPKTRKQSIKAYQARTESKIITLSAQGLKTDVVAKAVGLDQSTVKKKKKQLCHIINGIKDELKLSDKYAVNKSDILTAVELKVLRSLVDRNKLEDSSSKDCATILSKIHTINRLEQGKSTSNSSVSFTVNKVNLSAVER